MDYRTAGPDQRVPTRASASSTNARSPFLMPYAAGRVAAASAAK